MQVEEQVELPLRWMSIAMQVQMNTTLVQAPPLTGQSGRCMMRATRVDFLAVLSSQGFVQGMSPVRSMPFQRNFSVIQLRSCDHARSEASRMDVDDTSEQVSCRILQVHR
jgi:hypothetical protein